MTDIRVLLVDDADEARRDLHTLLALSGELVIVGEAANGVEAVRLAESLKPDVVMMDLEMPVMNGYESTRQIKMKLPSCKVIAFTVHEYESARTEAGRSGMDAFLVKGASLETIIQTVKKQKE